MLNNENSKNEKSNFVLNDIVKRKILNMYNISKPQESNITEETQKPQSPNENS